MAARAGADAVGVIRVPGAKRCVSVETAAQVVGALPAYVTPVLVYADATAEQMLDDCRRTGCRTVQLHGHEGVSLALELHARAGISVIKRLEVGLTLGAELDLWSLLDRRVLSGLLVEGPGRGGTGVATDWDSLEWALSAHARDVLPALVLAGGLTPANVGAAVRRFRPYAVDTSSGVENPAEALRKDPWRMEAFVDAVRKADAEGDGRPGEGLE